MDSRFLKIFFSRNYIQDKRSVNRVRTILSNQTSSLASNRLRPSDNNNYILLYHLLIFFKLASNQMSTGVKMILCMRIWFEEWFEGRFEGDLKLSLKGFLTNITVGTVEQTTLSGLELGLHVGLINLNASIAVHNNCV